MRAKSGNGLRRQRAERSRERLLRCAETVFARRGYEKAAIADITRHAGVSVGLFYHHFPSKEAVYNAIVNEGVPFFLDQVDACIDAAEGTREKIVSLIRGCVNFFESRRAFFRMRYPLFVGAYMLEKGLSTGPAARRMQKFTRRVEELMAGAVREGVLIRLDPALLHVLCRSLITTMLQAWLDSPARLSAEKKVELIRRIFFEGVGA